MVKEKCLVVGGTGFIGYNLLKKLIKKKYNLYSISTNKPIPANKIKNINYLICDLANAKKINSTLSKLEFDYVINLGGDINHSNSIKTFNSHYIGVKNLVKYLSLKKKIKLFIQAGSSLEYGNIKSPQKEKLTLNPKGYYGSAKYKASKFLLKKKLNFNFVILRMYQIYGPHQNNQRLIPFVINSCLKSKNFNCTSGEQIRDFLYVDDLINLILKILEKKFFKKKIYNVGSGKPIKIKKIIQIILNKIKKGNPNFGKIKMRNDEILSLYPDISLVKREFNWKPKININDGLKKTINFYARST